MALLRALLLLWMFSRCMGSSEPAHSIDLQHLHLPEAVQGFKVKDMIAKNLTEAKTAYKECMQHGSACTIPCSSISNCVGCHPAGPAGSSRGSTKAATHVCAYCLPGYKMSADRTCCQACPVGYTSKVGGVVGWGAWSIRHGPLHVLADWLTLDHDPDLTIDQPHSWLVGRRVNTGEAACLTAHIAVVSSSTWAACCAGIKLTCWHAYMPTCHGQ
jgi:hypothetical protein